MPEDGTRGPPVDGKEDLYRLITTKDWWSNGRPSSAAFKSPKFSVNVASIASVDDCIKQLVEILEVPHGGIVIFNCGAAKGLGYEIHLEPDEVYPENKAHAHCYLDGGSNSRMKAARKLAENHARCVREPSFPKT